MSLVFNRTRFLFGGLLVLHLAWIATHIYLVENNHLNRWKLGGYGMYTQPTPRFRLNAYVDGVDDSDQQWRNKPNFSLANWNFVMPCRPLSAKSIVGFYQDNPTAIGKTTHLLITIKSFQRYPIKAKYLPKIDLKIMWPDANTFIWKGTVCGEQNEGQGEWLL